MTKVTPCTYERRRVAIVELHKRGLKVKGITKALKLPETTVRYHLSAAHVQLAKAPVEPRQQKKRPEPTHEPLKQVADLDNPVTLGRMTLGNRVTERLGSYWIDGQPVGIDRLIQSANSVLKEQGKRQIRGKAEWAA